MDNLGFIHESLDIKILILFVLSNFSGPVDADTLSDLCRIDDGVGYFDYSDCLNDLVDTGHITVCDEGYLITEKGRKNAEAVSSSLPYSVRNRTLDSVRPIEERIRRNSMIKTGHSPEGESSRVNLTLSDGAGELINLSFICPDDETAEIAEKNFRANAEKYYLDIVKLFCEA